MADFLKSIYDEDIIGNDPVRLMPQVQVPDFNKGKECINDVNIQTKNGSTVIIEICAVR